MSETNGEYESESFAVLLLPGWRHPTTGKVHIRRECRAVEFHLGRMTPILVRLDDAQEVSKVLGEENLCGYCFAGF